MKTIKLKQYGAGRYDDASPFPLGDLELVLEGIPAVNSQFRFIAEMNGKKVLAEPVSAAKNSITIPADVLAAGRFSCRVEQYEKGICVKKYPVEDLLVTDLDGTLAADPEIARMYREIEELKELSVKLEETVRQLAAAADAAAKEHLALEKRVEVLEQNNDLFTA